MEAQAVSDSVAELQRERLTLATTHSKLVRETERIVARLVQVEALLDGIEAGKQIATSQAESKAPEP